LAFFLELELFFLDELLLVFFLLLLDLRLIGVASGAVASAEVGCSSSAAATASSTGGPATEVPAGRQDSHSGGCSAGLLRAQ